MLVCAVMTAVGFLSGSVMYSYLLPKWLRKIDIREQSADKNPGCMNAIASSGMLVGFLCLVLDLLKASIPVRISTAYLDVSGYALIPVIAAPVLGHAFSPFLRFRGGKAVSVAFGVLLGALSVSRAFFILVGVMVFFRFIIDIHPDSAKVVAAFSVTSILVLVLEPLLEIKIVVLLISVVVCGKHIVNPNGGELNVLIGPVAIVREGRGIRMKRKHGPAT